MTGKNLVRGLRNNNPFNIKRSSHPWMGKLKSSTDPTFEQFHSMSLGVRAGLKLLITYISRGYNTPEKIIHRFAPTSENNTSAYLDYICRNRANLHYISPNECVTSISVLCMLASRMIQYECCLNFKELECLNLTSSGLRGIIHEYNLLPLKKELLID